MASFAAPMLYPSEPASSPTRGAPFSTPRQAPVCSAIGFLHDLDSNRTYRIADVPATSSVRHIKEWYVKNVSSQGDTCSLIVLHENVVLEDSMPVWQLAQGHGQFGVAITQKQPSPRAITLLVNTSLSSTPIQLRLSSDSSILYTKQRLMEILNLPMSTAASRQTTLVLQGLPVACELQNDQTLIECGVPDQARLVLSLPQSDAPHITMLQPMGTQSTPSHIANIWSDTPHPNTTCGHALLPKSLLEDDDDQGCTSCSSSRSKVSKARSRGPRRSHSPPSDRYTNDQLQHLAANFRTKLCRNGLSCKFGRNCWFAHNGEELRKPSDALPKNLPAVHKLERYSHRESKERHN